MFIIKGWGGKSIMETKPTVNWVRVAVITGVALIAAGVFYWIGSNYSVLEETSTATVSTPTTPTTTLANSTTAATDETASWKTFSNTDFSVKYPSAWVTSLNELAGAQSWYETVAKQNSGDDELITIRTSEPVNETADQVLQSNKTAIEASNKNLTVTISSVTFGTNTFSRAIATNRTTGVIDNTETYYVMVTGTTLVDVYSKSISDSDLQNMLKTLQVK